jgi:hypothetical protein
MSESVPVWCAKYEMTDTLAVRHEYDAHGSHRLVAVVPGGHEDFGPWASYGAVAAVVDQWGGLYEGRTDHGGERVAAVRPLRRVDAPARPRLCPAHGCEEYEGHDGPHTGRR